MPTPPMPPETGLPPKFGGLDGAYLCVETLREHLDTLVLYLDRGFVYPGRPLKPMQRQKLDIEANAVGTCIELLTRNGNFSRERSESLQRVKGAPVDNDRKCVKCGAVLLTACECPHCGTAIQDQKP